MLYCGLYGIFRDYHIMLTYAHICLNQDFQNLRIPRIVSLGRGYFCLLSPAFSCATPKKGVAQLAGKSHVKIELFMQYHILLEK